jgi:hypothetical protein
MLTPLEFFNPGRGITLGAFDTTWDGRPIEKTLYTTNGQPAQIELFCGQVIDSTSTRRSAMRKIQVYATFWTMMLAVPFTVIGLVGAAYLANHLADITNAVTTLLNWRGIAIEGSSRWPELVGMVLGQMLILTILLITRRSGKSEEPTTI